MLQAEEAFDEIDIAFSWGIQRVSNQIREKLDVTHQVEQ